MRETVERELKFVPGEDFVLPALGQELPSRTFVSAYFDSHDLRLARRGITLRHRIEDGSRVWQLKIPSGAARLELEEAGVPARPPEGLSNLLVAHLRGAELVRVARLRTRRQTRQVDGAEIVDDSVSVLDGQRVTSRFRELEIELVGGDEATLARLDAALRDAGAEPAGTPKLFRVLGLELPAPARPVPPDAGPLVALRHGARRAVRAAPRARSRDQARNGSRGTPPDASRDPPLASVPPGRASASRSRVGGGPARRARVARLGARAGARSRRPARADSSRPRGNRSRRR